MMRMEARELDATAGLIRRVCASAMLVGEKVR